ncbi:MAG: hypothetical protein Kow0092_23700 [Deferrisomatales bacterium]
MSCRALRWAWLLVALAGCAPRAVVAPPGGMTVDPAPLVERLRAYNGGPRAVRVQGKLAVGGRGSALFGARAAEGGGCRLDAVAGPFGTLVLALACTDEGACRAYVPARRTVYAVPEGAWGRWVCALVRGRVPELGVPASARVTREGSRILALRGEGGWEQEVEFPPGASVPSRFVLLRDGRLQLEASYQEPFPVDGHPFPRRVEVREGEGRGRYTLEFRRVEADAEGRVPGLQVPPGTAVEPLKGFATWNETGMPLWLPQPET